MAKPKVIDHMGQIEQALEKVHAKQAALEATRNASLTLAEKLDLGKIRFDKLAETGREHLDFWGRAQGQQAPPMVRLTGENTSAAEAILSALHQPELAGIIHQAIEAAHHRHVESGGMVIPAADLPAAIAKAERALFDAECALESTYVAAEEAGIVVDRYEALSPESVLGVERGDLLPFDFHSEKMEAIVAARDGAHAAMSVARDRLDDAKLFLAKITVSSDPNFEPDEEDVAVAQKRIDRCKQALAARTAELQGRIRLAEALEIYVREHRRAKPCEPMHNPHKRPELIAEQPKPENWQERFNADDSE